MKANKLEKQRVGSFPSLKESDQNAVAMFIKSFADCENPVVIWNFTEVFRRSKISIQKEVSDILIPLFEKWSISSNDDISQSANSALKILQK